MTNEETIDAVLAWVSETVPEIGANVYAVVPPGKSKALPDCVAELASEGAAREDEDFPFGGLQQVGIYVWSVGLSIMVDAGQGDAGADTAQRALEGFVEALKTALFGDYTLGARVQMASALAFGADYTNPLVEYEDGTRGREVTLSMKIGELLEVE